MATNFYLETKFCDHCGRSDRLRIGCRSSGWKFLFRVEKDAGCYGQWVFKSEPERPVIENLFEFMYLHGAMITDDYNKRYTAAEFVKLVDDLQDAKSHEGERGVIIDEKGYEYFYE